MRSGVAAPLLTGHACRRHCAGVPCGCLDRRIAVPVSGRKPCAEGGRTDDGCLGEHRSVAILPSMGGPDWLGQVVDLRHYLARDGTKRFSELERDIHVIAQRMLAITLRGGERAGLISRTVHPSQGRSSLRPRAHPSPPRFAHGQHGAPATSTTPAGSTKPGSTSRKRNQLIGSAQPPRLAPFEVLGPTTRGICTSSGQLAHPAYRSSPAASKPCRARRSATGQGLATRDQGSTVLPHRRGHVLRPRRSSSRGSSTMRLRRNASKAPNMWSRRRPPGVQVP
ncbi:winged helix-turn-helix transcriptional regulator [Nonomuraea sp. NPDC050663]|uniref:winged helix-turn-helix transcriptional regulator n=1 Tax=Nonomuraea sp. NPDC050663 TaxID=3364370 RepID=UPI00378D4EDD